MPVTMRPLPASLVSTDGPLRTPLVATAPVLTAALGVTRIDTVAVAA